MQGIGVKFKDEVEVAEEKINDLFNYFFERASKKRGIWKNVKN